MFRPLACFIGFRYLRAKRRDQFVSFVSAVSLIGMVLGVLSLVVVKSVMNGFEAELRDRVLAAIPHGFLEGPSRGIDDWSAHQQLLLREPDVVGVAPYIGAGVMAQRGDQLRGAQLWAVDSSAERHVSAVADSMVAGRFELLENHPYGVVVGSILARQMGLRLGDSVTLIAPKVTVTPMGIFPRQRAFQVVGVFSVGAQLDASTLYISLRDGQKLLQMGDRVAGLRIALDDLHRSAVRLPQLAELLPVDVSAKDWSTSQGSLFQAVQMEKAMVAVLLSIIVLVAAFNIVSILAMLVNEKHGNIAVLRTMGASRGLILRVFMIQGTLLGSVGVLLGLLLGVPLAYWIGDLLVWVESLFNWALLDPQVYFINRLPSELWLSDLLVIAAGGVLLSFVATLYPAYQASKIAPAEVLRYS